MASLYNYSNVHWIETAQDLNEFFGELCTDDDYVELALLEIGPEVEVPEISERLVHGTY